MIDDQIEAKIQSLIETDRKAAFELTRDWLDKAPESPRGHHTMGWLLRKIGKSHEAIHHLQIAARSETHPEIENFLGRCFRSIGELDKALVHFLRAISLSDTSVHPRVVTYRAIMANTAQLLGDFDFARTQTSLGGYFKTNRIMRIAAYLAETTDAKRRDALRDLITSDPNSFDKPTMFWSSFGPNALADLDNKSRFDALLKADKHGVPIGIPETYRWPEEREAVVRAMKAAGNASWIAKSNTLIAGENTRIGQGPDTSWLDDLEDSVVQRYISEPYLYEGRKFNFRLYLSYNEGFETPFHLWNSGLVFISTSPYLPLNDGGDFSGHVVNPLLADSRCIDQPIGTFKTPTVPLTEFLHTVFGQTRARAIHETIIGLAHDTFQRIRRSSFHDQVRSVAGWVGFPPKYIGMDMTLDADLKPWLFEIQAGPGMKPKNDVWE